MLHEGFHTKERYKPLDGKISYDEPLETLANILEASIDTILYGSNSFKIERLSVLQQPIYNFYSLQVFLNKAIVSFIFGMSV